MNNFLEKILRLQEV